MKFKHMGNVRWYKKPAGFGTLFHTFHLHAELIKKLITEKQRGNIAYT